MVRFARAEGSKGSNKRQLEEATPWAEMVAQRDGNKRKRKGKEEEGKSQNAGGKKEEEDRPELYIARKLNQKTTQNPTKTETKNTTAQDTAKTTKGEEVEKEDSKPELSITSKPNQKTPQSTNKTKTKNTPLQETAKTLTAEEVEREGKMKDTPAKTTKGKKKGVTKEPEYTITPEGKRVKIFRDGTARTWFDLPYEESDTMTRYEGMWVKKAMVSELDRLKVALEEDGLDKKQMMKKMMKAKRKAHRELRIELIYQQKSLVSEALEGKGDRKTKTACKKKKKKKVKNGNDDDDDDDDDDDGKRQNSTKKTEKVRLKSDDSWTVKPKAKKRKVGDDSVDSEEESKSHSDDDGKFEVSEEGRLEPSVDGGSEKDKNRESSKDMSEGNQDGGIKKRSKKKGKEVKGIESETGAENFELTLDTEELDDGAERKGDGRAKERKSGRNMEETKQEIDAENDFETTLDMDQLGDAAGRKGERKTKKRKKKQGIEETRIDAEIDNEIPENDKPPTPKDLEAYDHPSEEKTNKAKKQTQDLNETQTNVKKNSETLKPETQETFNHPSKQHGLRYDLTKSFDHNQSPQREFEENELMTNYEGYWVLREDISLLDEAKESDLNAIYNARTDGSLAKELTTQEQITYQRAVKKRKRFYHKRLTQRLGKMGRRVDGREKTRKGGKKEDDEGKVVKFDGFWIKKDAASRLHRLRSKLQKEGLSQQEVDTLIQKERRKEERVLKNERRLVCLNCRQPGHMVSACPNIKLEGEEGQPSICYTCGSTEHTSSSCNLKKSSDKSFSFATCYICGEAGHISRQCPDNPRGLYPKGGACRGCGSVEHLAKDCPDLQKEKEESSIRVGRMKVDELEALDEGVDDSEKDMDEGTATHTTSSTSNRLKVVTF